MKKVRMLAEVSGTRDGVEWPKRGEVADLPDAEADDLIAAGIAAVAKDKDAGAATKPAGLTTGSGPVESAAVDTAPAKRTTK
jgi:hypothetical protein